MKPETKTLLFNLALLSVGEVAILAAAGVYDDKTGSQNKVKGPKTLEALRDHPWVARLDDERDYDAGIWIHLRPPYWSRDTRNRVLHANTVTGLVSAWHAVEAAPPWYNEKNP